MILRIATSFTTSVAVLLSGMAFAGGGETAGAHAAKASYLAAINANDGARVMAAVTDDVVLIAPNAPAMEGKAQVGSWVQGYFDAVETTWAKSSVEFVVSDDWAFERYVYTAVDRMRDGGPVLLDRGNGINIYRLESDGVWRVARDVWATSAPAEGAGVLPVCMSAAQPC